MLPQEQLLKHEKQQDAGEDSDRHAFDVGRLREGLGKNFEKRRAEQRADRKADENRHLRRPCPQRQYRRCKNAEYAAKQSRADNPGKDWHKPRNPDESNHATVADLPYR